ncbi:amino acid adenylation domain-containing protein [Streptomyces sp. NPDC057638]|uniref:non-ribosomal peptide synthetase n=1 Tax=Streptomyces sp. NPDC057638 TaxID=3346190 RepID=UPI00369023F3
MGSILDSLVTASAGNHTGAVSGGAEGTVLPVTASQRSLLFIQEATERADLYNISFRVTFTADVDPGALRSALRYLLDVQPTLRTEFTDDDGTVRARITHPGDVPLTVATSEATGDDWAAWLDEESRRFATLAVDLRTAPLCRFRLLRAPGHSALLTTVHHSVSDGVSMTALLDALSTGYRHAIGAPATPDTTLPAERERQLAAELAAQVRATDAAIAAGEVRQLADRIAGVPPTTLRPTPTRPVDTAYRGADLSLLLDTGERELVEGTARSLSTTPFAVLLATYAALLGQYAAQDQVIVGSPFSTRRTIASHDLAGFFVNTLPLVLPARDVAFDAHVAAVADVVREAKRYQAIPFDALVAEAAPERVSNRNPLFQSMFAMQDELRTRVELAEGLPGTVEFVSQRAARFDLWLGATPVEDGLLIEVEYDKDLLPASYAERFLAEYRALLLRAARDPRATLSGLTAGLDTRDAPELLRGSEARPDAGGGLVGLVLDAAWCRPTALAVSEPGGAGMTYRELADRTARAAAGLRRRGVRRSDVVAVVPENLADTVVSMLAILWCGATYLPIDTTLPPDRLAYMLGHAEAALIIGGRSVAPGEPARTTLADLMRSGRRAAPPELPDGTAPVYIMFTSGSTGRPKGVRMGQPALLNLLHWQVQELEMGPDTRFLQYAPLGFDVSYQEIFPTLAAGGTVHGLGPVDRRDLAQVVDLVARERLTHVYLPVAVLGAFADAVHEGGHTLKDVSHLCVSGEQLHLDSRSRRLLDTHDRLTLVNLYGPTETHAVTYQVLTGGPGERPSHMPIGVPLPGVDTYLLDRDGHPVPPGAVGELFFGGICVADGYVNDPERTAAAFLPAPDGTGRVYRTGDLALREEDGTLVFLGRRDSQVKVRGHRIELGELETAAERLPSVKAAAAAVQGTGEQAALCLFVLPAPGRSADGRELREALQTELPAYMVPRHILTIDGMPLTPNGKVDRPALLRGLAAGELASAETGGPATTWDPTPTEALVRGLWTEALGTIPGTADASFFLLGGNSFDVLRLLNAVTEATGVRVPVVDFFREPTIGALAQHVDTAAVTASAPGTRPAAVADSIPGADSVPTADSVPYADSEPLADSIPRADSVPSVTAVPSADSERSRP